MITGTRILLCAIAALAGGLFIFHVESIFRMPGFWSGIYPFYHGWETNAVIGGAFYLAVPLLILVAISMWWLRSLSLATCCVVPIAWVSFLFLIWAHKPWSYYGEFPWWMMKRDLIPSIGVALTTGWVFWRVADSTCLTRRSTGARL